MPSPACPQPATPEPEPIFSTSARTPAKNSGMDSRGTTTSTISCAPDRFRRPERVFAGFDELVRRVAVEHVDVDGAEFAQQLADLLDVFVHSGRFGVLQLYHQVCLRLVADLVRDAEGELSWCR